MNAGNIIVSRDDCRIFLIDYQHTGRGPRSLDFAALEGSLRICTVDKEDDIEKILKNFVIEKKLWEIAWHLESCESTKIKRYYSYWEKISISLISHAKDNFNDITEQEYAITCLLQGLRYFRVSTLGENARLRILVWISHLTSVILKNNLIQDKIS